MRFRQHAGFCQHAARKAPVAELSLCPSFSTSFASTGLSSFWKWIAVLMTQGRGDRAFNWSGDLKIARLKRGCPRFPAASRRRAQGLRLFRVATRMRPPGFVTRNNSLIAALASSMNSRAVREMVLSKAPCAKGRHVISPWTIWKENCRNFHPARCNMGRESSSPTTLAPAERRSRCKDPCSASGIQYRFPVHRL